jgi:hypothetical protein
MNTLNFTRASGAAFKGLLQSAVPVTPAAHELVNALHALSVGTRSPALDGGSRVWAHHWEWLDDEWTRNDARAK